MEPNYIVTTATVPETREHRYFWIEQTIDDPEVIRVLNAGIIAQTEDADPACKNPTRLMRLAGTINFPNADKRKKGRIDEVATGKAERFPPYALQTLRGTFKVVEKPAVKTAHLPMRQDHNDRYIESAIKGEIANLAQTPEGGRNDQLNKSAFALAGLLPPGEVKAALLPVALNIGLPRDEIEKTIDSACRAASPRENPERQKPIKKTALDPQERQDRLEGIVERAKDDPGEAYQPEILEAFADLMENDFPAWVTLRARLKRVGVGVTMLEAQIKKNDGELAEPDHLDLAREVVSNLGEGNIKSESAHVFLYHKSLGFWKTTEDRELKQTTQRIMERLGQPVSRALIDAVVDVLKSETYAPSHVWNPIKNIINVKNGELHWNGDSFVLEPHSRESYCTTQIPVEYEPLARCPRFKQFMDEIFVGDIDGKEKAQAILEMIGYSLVSYAVFERFMMLIGRGANGKSVILWIVRLLVGPENCAAVQPSQFSNKFQRAHLHMKAANIVTEIAEGGEIADAELKAIVSGESMTAEEKHKPPFDFTPFCTVWLGTNHMPHTRDFSDALFRRALVIPFNRVFKEGVDADPHLKDKLATELPGILNLALKAYGEVLKRGGFTEPQSCLDAKREWRLQADQAAQFVEERCILDPNTAIESGLLYSEYEQWALVAGIGRKLNRQNFTNRIERLGGQPAKGTKGRRVIHGIRLAGGRP